MCPIYNLFFGLYRGFTYDVLYDHFIQMVHKCLRPMCTPEGSKVDIQQSVPSLLLPASVTPSLISNSFCFIHFDDILFQRSKIASPLQHLSLQPLSVS